MLFQDPSVARINSATKICFRLVDAQPMSSLSSRLYDNVILRRESKDHAFHEEL